MWEGLTKGKKESLERLGDSRYLGCADGFKGIYVSQNTFNCIV